MNHFATFGDQTHEIKAGYRGWNYRSSEESRGTVNQQIYYYDTAGCGARACSFVTPNYVRVYGTPNREINKQDQTSIFFNDSWKINRNLTLNVGARFTRYKTSYPDQGNTGAGPYAIKATIAAKDFEATNHLAPRVSFVYDITGQGTMALKASYGRYYNDSSTNPARRAGHAAAASGTATRTELPTAWGPLRPTAVEVAVLRPRSRDTSAPPRAARSVRGLVAAPAGPGASPVG